MSVNKGEDRTTILPSELISSGRLTQAVSTIWVSVRDTPYKGHRHTYQENTCGFPTPLPQKSFPSASSPACFCSLELRMVPGGKSFTDECICSMGLISSAPLSREKKKERSRMKKLETIWACYFTVSYNSIKWNTGLIHSRSTGVSTKFRVLCGSQTNLEAKVSLLVEEYH